VFVYGRSYGTFLLHRYLQVAPTQATAVVFDSICGPRECRFPVPFDRGHAEMGERLLELCAADDFCGDRLPDPVGTLGRALTDLEGGGCASLGWSRDVARRTLGYMLHDAGARSYLPAAVYRLDRCAPGDVAALQHLGGRLFGVPDPAPPTYALRSLMLRDHILLSELWQEPTSAELEEESAALFTGGAVQDFPWLHAQWPLYDPDPLAASVAATSIPVLMLQGGLDPQTTPDLAQSLRTAFAGAGQYYVEVPRSTHGIINSAFLPGVTDHTCGTDLIGQFLADPATAPDAACAAVAAPLDFVGTPAGAQSLFGTSDPWN
jgi:pimeloyl-ACP methyl ester carboxylesterase